MAQTDLRPNANISSSGWDDGTAAFDFSLINEDIETGSPDTDYAGNANNNNGAFRVGFTNTPGDFNSTTNFDLKVRCRRVNRVDDNPLITVQLFDNTGTQVGSSYTIGSAGQSFTISDSGFTTITISDSAWDSLTQTQLDGAEVLVTYTQNNSGMPDTGIRIDVSAIEGLLDYSSAVVETPTPGGGIAGGVTPTPRAQAANGGATASGVSMGVAAGAPAGGADASGSSPLAVVTLIAAGAIAGGNPPLAPLVETPTPGGGIAGGVAPLILAALAPGGAIAGGNPPSESGATTETPTPGGGISGGNAPVALAALVIQGANASGLGATVLVPLSAQGASSGGRAPLETFPGAAIFDRNFDPPSPLPAGFDLPVPIGQVN